MNTFKMQNAEVSKPTKHECWPGTLRMISFLSLSKWTLLFLDNLKNESMEQGSST